MAGRGTTSTVVASPRPRVVVLGDAGAVRRWITPGRAAVLKTVGVPVLVVAALVWLAVVVLRAGGSGPPPLTAEFVDVSGHSYLDVQLDPSAKRFGSFSAFLPHTGRAWPKSEVTATRTSGGAVDLSYDGAGYLDPAAQADGATTARHFHPQRVRLQLLGRVAPADHRASVDIWVNGRHRRLVSRAQAGGAEPVVREFLTALNGHDWTRVYDLSDRYMRNGVHPSAFVLGVHSGAANAITQAEARGPTTYTTTPSGVRYARVPLRLTYRLTYAGTAPVAVDAVVVLAVDTGGWKVLGVE